MGLWNRLFGNGGDSRKTGIQSPVPNTSGQSASPVTFDSAMQVSAFWASVRLLSEVVSAMPLRAYNINPTNNIKTLNSDYGLWRLINYKPNRYQTRTEFFEQIMLNLVTNGNAYVVIQKTSKNKIVSLLPLVSSQMEPRLLSDGEVVYEYTTANSDVNVYSSQSIWHIKLFGNGLIGMSPLGYARNALGIAIALEDRVTTLAKNGGKTTGVLTVDDKLDQRKRDQIRHNYAALEEGGQDRLFVLEHNMTYQQTSLSPSDIQMIENRRFEVEDIARFMGVPSVLINDTSATTAWGSGIEQINMGFYKLNLRPYLERIESSMKRWLIPQSDWDKIEIEFDFDALLRADRPTRLDANSAAINSGQLTPNEARASEGLKPEDGGEKIYLNGSLVPAGTTQRQIQAGAKDGT